MHLTNGIHFSSCALKAFYYRSKHLTFTSTFAEELANQKRQQKQSVQLYSNDYKVS